MIRDRINALLKDSRFFLVRRLSLYLALVLACYLVLYWRYPNNINYANFYAEDGSVLLQNIIDKGWLEATLTPFNGYGVIGLYLIAALGWFMNLLFLGGGFEDLSAGFAMASVLFMSLAICLPYLLFSATFGKLKMLFVIILSALLPLPTSPHVVIGTIGNQKWIFLYIAFLLVLYRVVNHRTLSKFQLCVIDSVLLISAYTNSAVYVLMPLLLSPYIADYVRRNKRPRILTYAKEQLKLTQTRSLLLLGCLLLPQVVYVAANGLPELPGYLDTPFIPERAVELFVNRTYLFGLTHIVNGYLNDLVVVLSFILIVFFGWKWLSGKNRFVFFAGIYTAGLASLLFVLNRPGVTDHVFGYTASGSGPDQFFYAQTLIMYLPFILLASELAKRIPMRLAKDASLIIATGFVLGGGIVSDGYFVEKWRNASVFENDAGIFTDNALRACSDSKDSPVRITAYPYESGQFSVSIDRAHVCTDTLRDSYRISVGETGLKVQNNDYISLSSDDVRQTFVAKDDKLTGIRIFLSTFSVGYRGDEYYFKLLDQNCERTIREEALPNILADNAFHSIRFRPIEDSDGKTFCFKLEPEASPVETLAVQQSAPKSYNAGELYINGEYTLKDIVFNPLYDRIKD